MAESAQATWSRPILFEDAAADPVEALVRDHARVVYRIAYAVLRNHHDAEDATQETFLRVLRHRRTLSDIRNPRAWLARIAWRVAVERRRVPVALSLDVGAAAVVAAALRASGPSAEQLAASAQMGALLEALIASLPEMLRAALVLSTVEEMTGAEVAAALEIPEASVRNRIHRARRLLREKLDHLLESRHG